MRKIAIGNGFIGSYATNREIPVVRLAGVRLCSCNDGPLDQITLLESFPDLIGYDPDVFNYFEEQ